MYYLILYDIKCDAYDLNCYAMLYMRNQYAMLDVPYAKLLCHALHASCPLYWYAIMLIELSSIDRVTSLRGTPRIES